MGMTANYLADHLSIEELEKMMLSVLKEHVGGKSTIEWQVGDSAAKKVQWMQLPPAVRMQDIGQALSIKDPDAYPPDDNIAVTQTRVAFS